MRCAFSCRCGKVELIDESTGVRVSHERRACNMSASRVRTWQRGRNVRAFFGGLLGLEEIPPPNSLLDDEVMWFKIG